MKENASAKSDKKSAARNIKKRNWAFVLYPESAPVDWFEQLQQRGVVGAVSPLHDKDVNEDEERTPKKPHYHVLLVYKGPTAYSVVKALTDELNQPRPQAIEQLGGYYRYLVHQDNPEKYQYDPKDIRRLGGFEIGDYVDLTRSEKRRVRMAVRQYIIDHDICEYWELVVRLGREGLFEEEDYASNHTLELVNCLRSRRFMAGDEVSRDALIKIERQGDMDYVVDAQTGEVISEV